MGTELLIVIDVLSVELLGYNHCHIVGTRQSLRLTFQLASPVASDRFDSLARYSNIHHCIKSSK